MNAKDLINNRKKSKLTQKQLAEKLGVDRRTIINYEKGELIPESKVKLLHFIFDSINTRSRREDSSINITQGIPLLPIEAMAGALKGDVQVMGYECERYIIPGINKEADFLISVRGSSMYPKYSNGDIVACKKLESWSFFQYGKVYVIYTEQGTIIKRIYQASQEDHVSIISDNSEHYPSFELHKDEIKGLAIVVGVIRLE